MLPKFAQLDGLVDTTKKLLDKSEEIAGSDEKGTPKVESPVDFANKINQGEESGVAMYTGYGLTREDYEGALQALKTQGMTHDEAIQYVNDVAMMASESGTNPQALLPVALAIYTKVRPDAKRAHAIMGTLAQYESEFPGIGVFDLAHDAALGKPVGQRLISLRMALWGANDDPRATFNSTKPLEQAIIGIALPKSEMGGLLDAFNLQRQKRKQQMEALHINMARFLSVYGKEAEKAAAGIIKDLNDRLPGFASGSFGRLLFKYLTTIGTASSIWKGVKGSAGVGPAQITPNSGYGGFIPHQASTDNHLRLAQASPSPAGDPTAVNTPPGATTPNPGGPSSGQAPTNDAVAEQLNQAQQVANQSNSGDGTSNSAYASLLKSAPQASALVAQLMQQMRLAEERKQLYDTKHQIITTMSSQDAAYGVSGQDAQVPAMAPEKLEAVARELSQIAAEGEQAATQALATQSQLDSMAMGSQSSQAEVTGRAQIKARMEQILAEMVQHKREALELVIVGPIMQRIMTLKPYKDQLAMEIEYGREVFQGIGSDEYVLPFYSLCEELGSLYESAAQRFAEVLANTQSKDLATFVSTNQQRYMLLAKQVRLEGRRAVAELTGLMDEGSIGKVAAYRAHLSLKRYADHMREGDTKTADEETEQYWNDLLPGYGTELEHPAITRKVKFRCRKRHKA